MPIIKDDFDYIFRPMSQKYGVPFSWVKAVAGAESDYNPTAYRAEPQINDASRGLMQVLMKTAVALGYLGEPEGLFDPFTNVELGTKLLAENIRRFGLDFSKVYSTYNSGSPTAYQTNTQVKAHLDRAIAYLYAVNADIQAKAAASSANSQEEPSGSSDETSDEESSESG